MLNNQIGDFMKNMQKLILSVLAIAILVFIFLKFVPGISGEVETITVSGEATKYVDPDISYLYLQIQNTADSARQAQIQNSETTQAVTSALKDLGTPEGNIETTYYSVSPKYSWDDGTRTPDGYEAIHSLKVKIEELENVGKCIDTAVNSGATISYISFELTEEAEAEAKNSAIEEASASAKSKAQAIADSMDVRLKGIYKITESNVNYYPYIAEARVDSAGDEETKTFTVSPSDVSVQAQITVQYRI